MPLVTAELSSLISIGLVQIVAVISPGPSFLITARTSVASSRLDGVMVGLGIAAGTVVWSSLALLGLNAIFHALPAVFMAMKVVGALFILWVAYQIFRHAAEPAEIELSSDNAGSHPFVKGFTTQMSNPKAAVFFGSIFVAMLPSDIPLWMILALIAIVTFNEIWWYTIVALFFGAGPVRRFYIRAKVWIDRATGLFLGALGLRLLWAARESA
jgi:threonine/homoserine/homoserine lactone efflux protein